MDGLNKMEIAEEKALLKTDQKNLRNMKNTVENKMSRDSETCYMTANGSIMVQNWHENENVTEKSVLNWRYNS